MTTPEQIKVKIQAVISRVKSAIASGNLTRDEGDAVIQATIETLAPAQPGQETSRRIDQLDNQEFAELLKANIQQFDALGDAMFEQGGVSFAKVGDAEFEQALKNDLKALGLDGGEG